MLRIMEERRRSHPRVAHRAGAQDAVLACALGTVCLLVNDPVGVLWAAPGGPLAVPGVPTEWLWWGATVGLLAAVTLRRRWPLPMLALATLASATHVASGVRPMVVDAGTLVLLHTVAAYRGRATSTAALCGLVALVAAWSACLASHGELAPGLPSAIVRVDQDPGSSAEPGDGGALARDRSAGAWTMLLVYGLALTAAWSAGLATRNRRAYQEQLRARARALARERDQRAALAMAAERARISREMHDIVAHGLSVIVIQAQGAAAALHDAPVETEAALDAIVTTGRDSLADMRRVLAAVGETDDGFHPRPGLGHLAPLLGGVRRAGTPVRLRIEGDPTGLPPAVDLSAYRLVQEALTNTMKHAGAGASASVVVTCGQAEVRVEVRDDGRGAPSVARDDGGGNGLRGMGERVRLLGGRLDAGPGPEGGFVVRAVLPVRRPVRAPGPPPPATRRPTGGRP